jgi:hypothetical protein
MYIGLLKPDHFADQRFSFQLPGVGAFAVLLCRNHNYIAKQLLEVADAQEDYRFTRADGPGSRILTETEQDEQLFQTARLINGACYANLILHEYVRTILGLSGDTNFLLNPLMEPPANDSKSGNVCSIEFNFVYRWHSAIGEETACFLPSMTAWYFEI